MIGNAVEHAPQDVSFRLRARAAGLTIFVDFAMPVGHEKRVIL